MLLSAIVKGSYCRTELFQIFRGNVPAKFATGFRPSVSLDAVVERADESGRNYLSDAGASR